MGNLAMLKVMLFHLLNLTYNGFLTIGVQMVATYGKKLEVATFSGIEQHMFTLLIFVKNFLLNLEILLMLQNVQVQKMQ